MKYYIVNVPNFNPHMTNSSMITQYHHHHHQMDQSDTFSLDLEGGANQCEERGVEGHHPVTVQRHVHRHQTLRDREFC